MGCVVGSSNNGGGSGGVDEIVAKGPEDVWKQYFPLAWQNCLQYDGGEGGGGGGKGDVDVL